MTIVVPSHVRDEIDKIMDQFDFSRVEDTMKRLKWTWAYTETPDKIHAKRIYAVEPVSFWFRHGNS